MASEAGKFRDKIFAFMGWSFLYFRPNEFNSARVKGHHCPPRSAGVVHYP
jgi:hypothetical protein